MKDTSWEIDANSYTKLVGRDGHYFHQSVIIPGVLELLRMEDGDALLDVGCGQGVMSRLIGEKIRYVGIDASRSLIEQARKLNKNSNCKFEVVLAEKMDWDNEFDKSVAILSLQNMRFLSDVIKKTAKSLKNEGVFVMVVNHPCFRIPRHTGWGEHENKLQYRYVNRYLSSLEIPILMHPGRSKTNKTWSYHYPLSDYVNLLAENGLLIDRLEEWTSDKQSFGKMAKMENRSRNEIPLFMAIRARKMK